MPRARGQAEDPNFIAQAQIREFQTLTYGSRIGFVAGRANVTGTPLPFWEALLLLWGSVRTAKIQAVALEHITCSEFSET